MPQVTREAEETRPEGADAGQRPIEVFVDVQRAEWRRIGEIRRNKQACEEAARSAAPGPARAGMSRYPSLGDSDEAHALALSGGGIRSAAFNLGVLQSLAGNGLLARMDYLSTVSGGGYIGSALTWFLSPFFAVPGARRSRAEFGTAAADSPLGRKDAGARTGTANDFVDHIRCFGDYLRPTPKLWAGSAVAVVLQTMIVTTAFWFFPLVALLVLLDGMGLAIYRLAGWPATCRPAETLASELTDWTVCSVGNHLGWLWCAAGVFALLGLLRVRFRPAFDPPPDALRNAQGYLRRLNTQSWMGVWLVGAALCAILAALPSVTAFAGEATSAAIGAAGGGLGGLAAVVYGLAGKLPTGGSGPLGAKFREIALRVGLVVLAGAILVGALLVARYVLPALLDRLTSLIDWQAWFLGRFRIEAKLLDYLGVAAAALILAAFAVAGAARKKLNRFGLHRFYRDRLMEAFLPDREPFLRKMGTSEQSVGTWHPASTADQAPLHRMCDPDSRGPYHLINANVILVGSPNASVRGRGGESFLLSPLYSGCERTGWVRTEELTKDPDPSTGKTTHLQLSTAMAVSGAAANPGSGPGGQGLMRGAIVSRLMMLFNIRLGYWVPNPQLRYSGRADNPPRFLRPGLSAVLGTSHEETSAYLELSDGGHFDNLGLYELIRRRVPLIIASDAGQDEGHALADLGSAIERVRVDYGVHVRFRYPEADLAGLLASADKKDVNYRAPIGAGDRRLAERAFAIAEIDYPAAGPEVQARAHSGQHCGAPTEAFTGCLVYLKPLLVRGLPASVYAYAAAKASFPHQTTADQFFDEAQFEAYRELGHAVTEDLLAEIRQLASAARRTGDGEDWLDRLWTLADLAGPGGSVGDRPRRVASAGVVLGGTGRGDAVVDGVGANTASAATDAGLDQRGIL